MAAPQIVEIHPDNSQTGVVLNDKIWVVFDQEVDTESVQIIVEGADTDRWSGPDQVIWDDPSRSDDDDVLATPGYKGVIQGTLTFEKVDESGNNVSGYDYTGGGSNWRTKAIFTPTLPLAPSQGFRVYIPGDDNSTDLVKTGASRRTIFDPVKGSNGGSGSAYFSGSYSGTSEDKIFIRVVSGNQFHWWTQSAPLITRVLPIRQTSQLLLAGVSIRFDTGSFDVGDEFSVVVQPAVRMEGTYTWIFTTGAGTIRVVPDEVSDSIPVGGFAGDTAPSGSVAGSLQIVSTTPRERSTNLDPNSITQIRIKFNKELDPDTITDDSVEVFSEPVNGIFEGNPIQYEGNIPKVLTVEGDTLIITIG